MNCNTHSRHKTVPALRFTALLLVTVMMFSALLPAFSMVFAAVAAEKNTYALTARSGDCTVAVIYDESAGIPRGAKLSVKELQKEDKGYADYLLQSEQAAGVEKGTAISVRMFDISIFDANNSEIEPSAPVEVRIQYDADSEEALGDNGVLDAEREQTIKVVHFVSEDNVQVIEPQASLEENGTVALNFKTESFSLYTVVKLDENPTSVNFDGYPQAFAIVANRQGWNVNSKQAMKVGDNGFGQVDVAINGNTYTSAAQIDHWVFEKQNNGKYKIKYNEGDGYLGIGDVVSVSDRRLVIKNENDADEFTVEKRNGYYFIYNDSHKYDDYTWTVNKLNTPGYALTNDHWNENGVFTAHDLFTDDGNYMYLLKEALDLNGKQYAIISTHGQRALIANEDNTIQPSQALIVDFANDTFLNEKTADGNKQDITIWKFTANNNGTYRISTVVNGQTKYLKYTNNYGAHPVLVDSANEASNIIVYVEANGCLTLRDADNNAYLLRWAGDIKTETRNNGPYQNDDIFGTGSCDCFVLCTPLDVSADEYAIFNPFGYDYTNEQVTPLDDTTDTTGQRSSAVLSRNKGNNELSGKAYNDNDLFYVWNDANDPQSVEFIYGENADMWIFDSVEDGKYILNYIDNGDRQFLYIGPNGAHTYGSADFYGNEDDFKVDVVYDSNAKRYTISRTVDGSTYYLTLTDHSNRDNLTFGAVTEKYDGNNARYQQFVLAVKSDPVNNRIDAEKITVQELRNLGADNQVIIYYRTGEVGNYQYFALDKNGNAVSILDSGSTITFSKAIQDSISWKVSSGMVQDTTEYRYMFSNGETQLFPNANGLFTDLQYGVMLPGDSSETGYSSTIRNVDNELSENYGIAFNKASGTFSSVSGVEGGVFFFARTPIEKSDDDAALHRVSTVDSAADGIIIRMFDYDDAQMWTNVITEGAWLNGTATTGIIKNMLDENGNPVPSNGENSDVIADLFSTESDYYKGEANHLFIKSVYDSTGYYHYRSWENYAYWNNYDFIVYDALGIPIDNHHTAAYSHGNFMPYDPLENPDGTLAAHLDSHNYFMFDSNGRQLNTDDPRLGEKLYMLNNPNYYLGMTIDSDFVQPKNGLIDGENMRFELNGDDDMWVFADGVILLDIGGIHDPRNGYIDFKTGEIWQQDGGRFTIRQRYEEAYRDAVNEGRMTQDEADALMYKYFGPEESRSDTYINYSKHHLKMFYLERGAGASNLDIRFNMMAIEPGEFKVEKKIVGSDGAAVDFNGLAEFQYKAYIKANNEISYSLLKGTDVGTKTYLDGSESKISIGDDGIFYLKPGETVTFKTENDEVKYYVQEIGLPVDLYDVTYNGESPTSWSDNNTAATSSEAEVGLRPLLSVENVIDLPDLEIIKVIDTSDLGGVASDMPHDAIPDATFSFQVFAQDISQNVDDDPKAYSGFYYIKKLNDNDNGVYYIFNDNNELVPARSKSEAAIKASENGLIELIPEGYTVEIDNLLPGTKFKVVEINVPSYFDWKSYVIEGADDPIVGRQTNDGTAGTIKITKQDGQVPDVKVTVTNTPKTVDVQLLKEDDKGNPLLGAQFSLYWGRTPILSDIVPTMSGSDGDQKATATISNLIVGNIYQLIETNVPDGYVAPTQGVYFRIDLDGKAKLCDQSGEDLNVLNYGASITDDNSIILTIKNTPGVALPITGGPGVETVILIGGLMVLIAATGIVLLHKKKLKERS